MKPGEYLSEEHEALFLGRLKGNSCCHCRFWWKHDDPTYAEQATEESLAFFKQNGCGSGLVFEWTGCCRRRAPVIPPTESAVMESGLYTGVWPETNFYQLCGEFEG